MLLIPHSISLANLFRQRLHQLLGTDELNILGSDNSGSAASAAKAAKDAGLRLDIEAPTEKYPSMTSALQHYLIENQE